MVTFSLTYRWISFHKAFGTHSLIELVNVKSFFLCIRDFFYHLIQFMEIIIFEVVSLTFVLGSPACLHHISFDCSGISLVDLNYWNDFQDHKRRLDNWSWFSLSLFILGLFLAFIGTHLQKVIFFVQTLDDIGNIFNFITIFAVVTSWYDVVHWYALRLTYYHVLFQASL